MAKTIAAKAAESTVRMANTVDLRRRPTAALLEMAKEACEPGSVRHEGHFIHFGPQQTPDHRVEANVSEVPIGSGVRLRLAVYEVTVDRNRIEFGRPLYDPTSVPQSQWPSSVDDAWKIVEHHVRSVFPLIFAPEAAVQDEKPRARKASRRPRS